MKKIFISVCAALLTGVFGMATAYAAVPTLDILTEPIWDDAGHYSEGLIWVKQNGVVKYLDENGKVVIDGLPEPADFDPSDCHEGLIYVFDGYLGNHAYVDKTGKEIVKASVIPFAVMGYEFSEDVVIVEDITGKVHTLDKNGAVKHLALDASNLRQFVFREGLLCYGEVMPETGDMKYGFVDKNGEIVIPLQFDDVTSFNQGLAFAQKGDLWGVIDKTGNFVIEPQFEDFWPWDYIYFATVFVEELACVQKDGKWGFIDKTGKVIVDFQELDEGSTFDGGLAVVLKDGKYGYIDKTGNMVISPQFDDANGFYNGVALVGNGSRYMLIDRQGNAVSEETWDFDETLYYISPEMVVYLKDGKKGIARISSGGESPAPAADTVKAIPTRPAVLIDGEAVEFEAYNINGSNYFKLRDVAMALTSGDKRFNVTWDAGKNAINLLPNTAYVPAGGELLAGDGKEKTASASSSAVYKNGAPVSLTAYNINGNNYFKLRDIAKAFDIRVDFDAAANTITVNTGEGYAE